MALNAQFFDSSRSVRFYGTTPPRLGASPEEMELAAQKLVARTESLPLDALVVYDVQDESARTAEPRPFPFLPTLDARVYSQYLHQLSGVSTITYKPVGGMDETQWCNWLDHTQSDFGLCALSLVGSATRHQGEQGVSLLRAIELAKSHSANFSLGGVAIAERHGDVRRGTTRSESSRMIEKAQAGCDFFVSQSVYDAHKTIALLNDYARDCRTMGLQPKRCILTFAPCGRAKTLEFIQWLGVSVPPATAHRILDAAEPLKESIAICRSVLLQILEGLHDQSLPLGLNIESVSIRKDEIDASIDLFHVLDEVLTSFEPKIT